MKHLKQQKQEDRASDRESTQQRRSNDTPEVADTRKRANRERQRHPKNAVNENNHVYLGPMSEKCLET